jgi:hypothetical protein
MTRAGVQEIAAGIWCWQRRPRGLRPGEFGARTSYALAAGGETLLIDPLVEGDDDPALGTGRCSLLNAGRLQPCTGTAQSGNTTIHVGNGELSLGHG